MELADGIAIAALFLSLAAIWAVTCWAIVRVRQEEGRSYRADRERGS